MGHSFIEVWLWRAYGVVVPKLVRYHLPVTTARGCHNWFTFSFVPLLGQFRYHVLPCPWLVASYLTFPAYILSIVITIPGWPSGTEIASAVVLRRAENDTVIPICEHTRSSFDGNNIVVMIFAYIHPVTGKYEEDCHPLVDVSLWIEKSKVNCRLCHIDIALALFILFFLLSPRLVLT